MSTQQRLVEAAEALKGKTKPKKSTWKAPTPEALAEGKVLAFDQTFSKTGWALLDTTQGGCTVLTKGYIQEPPIPDESSRFRDILRRTDWMGERITEVVRDCLHVFGRVEVLHEAPILHGNRVEASLLGAVKVWEACKTYHLGQPVIIENRRMLTVLVPPGERVNQTGKSHIRRALEPFVDTSGRGWNEHNRDALALALTYLHDKKKAA